MIICYRNRSLNKYFNDCGTWWFISKVLTPCGWMNSTKNGTKAKNNYWTLRFSKTLWLTTRKIKTYKRISFQVYVQTRKQAASKKILTICSLLWSIFKFFQNYLMFNALRTLRKWCLELSTAIYIDTFTIDHLTN